MTYTKIASAIFFFIFIFTGAISVNTRLLGPRYVELPVEILTALGPLFFITSRKHNILFLLYLFFVFVTGLWSPNWIPSIRYISIAIYAYYGISYFIKRESFNHKILFYALNAASLVMLIYTLSNFGKPIMKQDVLVFETHAHPITASRLSQGFFISIVFITNILHVIKTKHTSTVFISSFFLLISVFQILLTEARSAIFSTIIVTLFLTLATTTKHPSKSIISSISITLASISLLFIFPDHFEKLIKRFEGGGFQTNSFHARTVSWKAYLIAASHEPLGLGFESSIKEFSQDGKYGYLNTEVEGAHNEHLKILVETGWVGFGLWATLLASAFTISLIKVVHSRDLSLNVLLPFSWFNISLIQFFTNNEMQAVEVSFFFWISIAMIFVKSSTIKSQQRIFT